MCAFVEHDTFFAINKWQTRRVVPSALTQNREYELALTSLKTRIRFVDDINPTLATDELVVAMAFQQCFE
jgi:hypothetical protein